MITQFHVENFKALKNVTLDLTPIHVLIGPNDSGKTSILQAMAAMSLSCDKNVNECFVGRHAKSPILWNSAPEGSVAFSVKLHDEIENSNIDYSLKLAVTRDVTIIDKECVNTDVVRSSDTVFTFVKQQKLSPNQRKAAAVYRLLSGASYFHWNAHYLTLPVSLDQSRVLRMETNGFGLAQFLDDILSADPGRFISIEKRFKSYFPNVRSILLQLELAYRIIEYTDISQLFSRNDGKGIWFQFNNFVKPVAASQISEGMIIVLAYLAVLYSPSPPRILLIEEPENGIHPQRLKEILKILRELVAEQKHTQIVMTTHSPDVVAEFSPEEVTLCSKNEEGAVVTRRLADIPEVLKACDFFTLGEIWSMKGDDVLMASQPDLSGVAS